MLRKAGYNSSEVFSTSSTGYDLPLVGDHPGHAYNLVLLPGDTKYHIVDTTGNGDGINLGGVPGYFRFTGCFLGKPSADPGNGLVGRLLQQDLAPELQ